MNVLRVNGRRIATIVAKEQPMHTRSLARRRALPPTISPLACRPAIPAIAGQTSSLHTTARQLVALTPESEDPPPPPDKSDMVGISPSAISEEEFHQKADQYMEALLTRLEQLCEQKEGVDVEYSAGVLTLVFPPMGTYVLNKQPPNKQIWLSSPISGPKRFDWVVSGEGQHEKEGAGKSQWIYTRDGTALSSLLRKEVGINVEIETNDI